MVYQHHSGDAVLRASLYKAALLLECAAFSVYFVALPIIVLVTSFLSPWVREKTVGAMTTSVHCFVYLSLIYMLWPTRTPRYFERLYSVSSPSEKASLRDQHLPTEEL
ncbi:hypothetical protein PC128_g2930 [Phytophthora cactorum]|nr:hypothetical protein PC128_g2930 [Phytophthora cactorum]